MNKAMMYKQDEIDQAQIDKILFALDDAIEKGPWDKSNFLKIVGAGLRELQEKMRREFAQTTVVKASMKTARMAEAARNESDQLVYVAIYSTEGTNLSSWERVLNNLPKQIVSRPIYTNEEDARQIIRTKENRNNEAYALVRIRAQDIIPLNTEKMPVDKLGKPLITIKDKSITIDHIEKLFHNDIYYRFYQGRLLVV